MKYVCRCGEEMRSLGNNWETQRYFPEEYKAFLVRLDQFKREHGGHGKIELVDDRAAEPPKEKA